MRFTSPSLGEKERKRGVGGARFLNFFVERGFPYKSFYCLNERGTVITGV